MTSNAMDHFSGAVPTAAYFRMTLDDLREICSRHVESAGINRELELCLIGLTAYFEAFCKDLFAALVNIEPSLLERLATAGQRVDIDSRRLLLLKDDVFSKLGFLVSERFDFGTPKQVNVLFSALLGVTPFTKKDCRRFESILRDRNLLVHHGGTYTLSYLDQLSLQEAQSPKRAYMDSLVFSAADVQSAIDFVGTVADKTALATRKALESYASDRGIKYDKVRIQAIRNLDRSLT